MRMQLHTDLYHTLPCVCTSNQLCCHNAARRYLSDGGNDSRYMYKRI